MTKHKWLFYDEFFSISYHEINSIRIPDKITGEEIFERFLETMVHLDALPLLIASEIACDIDEIWVRENC
jgi:hypothetical protein